MRVSWIYLHTSEFNIQLDIRCHTKNSFNSRQKCLVKELYLIRRQGRIIVSFSDRQHPLITCLRVPGVGKVVLTARKHKGATGGEGAVDLLPEVQRPDVLLHHPLSATHNTPVHSIGGLICRNKFSKTEIFLMMEDFLIRN